MFLSIDVWCCTSCCSQVVDDVFGVVVVTVVDVFACSSLLVEASRVSRLLSLRLLVVLMLLWFWM